MILSKLVTDMTNVVNCLTLSSNDGWSTFELRPQSPVYSIGGGGIAVDFFTMENIGTCPCLKEMEIMI